MTIANFIKISTAASITLSIIACGGGDNKESANPQTDLVKPINYQVDVYTRLIPSDDAVICLDLNKNLQCDPSDPLGKKKVSWDRNSFIEVDPNAVDSSTLKTSSIIAIGRTGSEGKDPVLRQIPGKDGRISGYTTLMAMAMDGGMTEEQARSNLAVQLNLFSVDMLDKPEGWGSSGGSGQPHLPHIGIVEYALRMNVAKLADQQYNSPAMPGELINLAYKGANDYSYQEVQYNAKTAETSPLTFKDTRKIVRDGLQVSNAIDLSPTLYRYDSRTAPFQSEYKRCAADTLYIATRGNPRYVSYCNKLIENLELTTSVNIENKSIAQLLKNQPNISGLSNTNQLMKDLGDAKFPAGSELLERRIVWMDSSPMIDYTDSNVIDSPEIKNLEALVNSNLVKNVDMATGKGMILIKDSEIDSNSNPTPSLHIAFQGEGVAQLYECMPTATGTVSNCKATNETRYGIKDFYNQRIMEIVGTPRFFIEVKGTSRGDVVALASFNNIKKSYKNDRRSEILGLFPDSSVTVRNELNAVAWQAVKKKLNLQ